MITIIYFQIFGKEKFPSKMRERECMHAQNVCSNEKKYINRQTLCIVEACTMIFHENYSSPDN